MFILIKSFA